MAQNKNQITDRLKELYIYDLYGYRPEIKMLSSLLYVDETINCLLTGVYSGLRDLVCVTDSRLIVIGKHLVSGADLLIFPRQDILSFSHQKKFFDSSVTFSIKNGDTYTFTGVSKRVLELFDWALEREIKVYDK